MMAGLLVNAGVGLLILFRLNRDRVQNLKIVGVLYGLGVFWELLLNLQELFSDQPSLLCQKKLILGGMIKLWQEAVMRQQAAEKYLNI